jgi:hypothetical protein
MSQEHELDRFHEVDPQSAKAGLQAALESLNLSPEELLLGKVDEHGDLLWMGCPRWLRAHPGTLPTVDGIIDEIFGTDGPPPARSDDSKGRCRPEEQ